MTDKLDLIRQKCIEANSEIVEMHTPFCDMEESAGHYRDCRLYTCVMREIRLADILLAVEETKNHLMMVSVEGEFYVQQTPYLNAQGITWNLREDDLSKQSEEIISFLYDLLTP